MYILRYDEIDFDLNAFSASVRFRDVVKEKIQQKYSMDAKKDGIGLISAKTQLYKMLCLKPRLVEYRLRVLDLGCGRVKGDCYYTGKTGCRQYEPWLARMLCELGVPVIGIDTKDLETEGFENYTCNLLDDDLAFLPDSSIDITNASYLFNSPTLKGCISPSEEQRRQQVGTELKAKLMPQLQRVVKPEGFFIYDEKQNREE